MKKKVRNNKVILASILALGCLTAASVGFSSWVIAAQDTHDTSNVNVDVADVEDHRFNVAASPSDLKIKLGPNKKGTFISYSGSASEEELGFNFKLTFTTIKGESFDFASLGNQSFDIKFSFTDKLNINDAKNTYINFPDETTIGTISKSGFTAKISGAATDPKSSNVITYSGELTWGSYFGGKNPSELEDPSQVDSYITGLNHLKTSLDGKSFVITVNIVKVV